MQPSSLPQPHRSVPPITRTFLILLTAASLDSSPLTAAPSGMPAKKGAVTATLHADREAVFPGDTLELAIELKIAEGWHIYWQNPAGTGLPTEVAWTAPQGVQFSRLLYPPPESKYDRTLKETSYILAGTQILLTRARIPETAKPGGELALTAKISWLACKKECIPGDIEIPLFLPIVAKGLPSKPANTELFDQARAALPVPTNKAEHYKLTATLDPQTLKAGAKSVATLALDIEARHHMQSNKPEQDFLIPAILFMEQTEGLSFGEITYPAPHLRTDKALGKLSEYSGKITFTVPVEVDAEADTAPRWIRGVLQSQICTDAGICFPPTFVEFDIPVRMEGGPAPVVEQFAASAAPAASGKPTPRGLPQPRSVTPTTPPTAAQTAAKGAPSATADTRPAPAGIGNWLTHAQDWLASFGIWGILLMGFIGGMILNIMPCVLPVISLKVLSFVRQAHEHRLRVFQLGMVYSAGILSFFALLTFLFLWFKTGWGELFQSPHVVIILSAIVFAFALSLFGVFAVFTPRVVSELGAKAEGETLHSAFFTGVLATLLGTACTGPFLSAALGYASQLRAAYGAAVFMSVGLGMAFPFLLLSAQPAWIRFVPRPGPWTKTFEEVMAFILLGTVIWLLNPLRDQVGAWGMLLAMIFLIAVAIACLIKGRIAWGDSPRRKLTLYATATLVLLIGWLIPFGNDWVGGITISSISQLVEDQADHRDLIDEGRSLREFKRELKDHLANSGGGDPKIPSSKIQEWIDGGNYALNWDHGIPWQRYSPDKIRKAVDRGYTVFVDYTASWCASCKGNLQSSINVSDTIQVMMDLGVVPFEADYSLKDPKIRKDLDRYQRAGVPMYLVYSPGDPDHPQVLPEVLTPGTVIDALKKAGPSRPTSLIKTASAP